MGKRKSVVKDDIEKFVRSILDEHGELESKELENAVIKAGFKKSTYEAARVDFGWIDFRKEKGNRTLWFVKEIKSTAHLSSQPRWSLPSIILRTLSKDDTVRMLRTIGDDDPLLRHLLELLEAENFEDAEQQGYDKGYKDGCQKGREEAHKEGLEEALIAVEKIAHRIEGGLDATPLIKSTFDELLYEIDQLRFA